MCKKPASEDRAVYYVGLKCSLLYGLRVWVCTTVFALSSIKVVLSSSLRILLRVVLRSPPTGRHSRDPGVWSSR